MATVETDTKAPEAPAATSPRTYSGSVLDVLEALLRDSQDKQVVELVRRLLSENEKLTRDLQRARARGSKSSEGVNSAQLDLLLKQLLSTGLLPLTQDDDSGVQDEAGADAKVLDACEVSAAQDESNPPTPPAPKGNKRRKLPEGLERKSNPLLVPQAERCCPECGCEMKTIEFESTEIIDFIAARVIIRVDEREKVGCTGCRTVVVRAPLGDKVIAGGIFGSATVAEFIVDKYRDGLTLHRIRERFQRMGIDIASATISDQILWAAELMQPIVHALLDLIVNANLMQLDGTGIKVMHQEKGQAREQFFGTLTGAIGDGCAAVYTYASSGHKIGQREGDLALEDLLRMRPSGLVLADASNHFDASFKRPELIEVGCNMHSRRGFAKALEAGNERAAVAIKAFKQLYDIEDEVREAASETRAQVRGLRSRPVYDALVQWCVHIDRNEPPSSLIAVAARYVFRHQVALTRFLDDGSLPIDNGAVERMHRRPGIVRKNMLFAGSHDGARRAAIMFSVFATCELIGCNPALYLADVLPKLARGISIARDLPALMPKAWLDAHPDAVMPKLNTISTLTQFRD